MTSEQTLPATFESALQALSDEALLDRLAALTLQSRRTEAELVAHIGEVDRRRLHLREACESMFVYCTERLHLSEAEAYLRITAARAAREHPVLLDMLADGRLHLSAIALLAPCLTAANCDGVLAKAAHRSKRQVAELVAELAPRPDVPPAIRKLPALSGSLRHGLRPDGVPISLPPANPAGAPRERVVQTPTPATARPATVEPIAPARYKVVFTASAELRDKLERLRDLMRPSVPDGDLAAIIDQAVTEKLRRLEARRFAETERPRKTEKESAAAASRLIPAEVRRAVSRRDERRCAFVGAQGRRCKARGGLEFHHRRPYGYGGGHSVDNIGLLCRAHNRHLAEVDYGRRRLGASSAIRAAAIRGVSIASPRTGSQGRAVEVPLQR